MCMYIKAVSFIQADRRRELTVAESSDGSMLPWPSRVIFLMLTHFSQNQKSPCSCRGISSISVMQPARHLTFIPNVNGVCAPALCCWARDESHLCKGAPKDRADPAWENCSQCTKSSTSCNAETFGKWTIQTVLLESHNDINPLLH